MMCSIFCGQEFLNIKSLNFALKYKNNGYTYVYCTKSWLIKNLVNIKCGVQVSGPA